MAVKKMTKAEYESASKAEKVRQDLNGTPYEIVSFYDGVQAKGFKHVPNGAYGPYYMVQFEDGREFHIHLAGSPLVRLEVAKQLKSFDKAAWAVVGLEAMRDHPGSDGKIVVHQGSSRTKAFLKGKIK